MGGAPFDEKRGVIPSADNARVDGCSDVYVTGWLKRGPSGVILTNVTDAQEVAAAVLADRAEGKLAAGGDGGAAVRSSLAAKGSPPVLDFAAWQKIDALEMERGAAVGKVREKLVTVDEMMAVGTSS